MPLYLYHMRVSISKALERGKGRSTDQKQKMLKSQATQKLVMVQPPQRKSTSELSELELKALWVALDADDQRAAVSDANKDAPPRGASRRRRYGALRERWGALRRAPATRSTPRRSGSTAGAAPRGRGG